MAKGKTGTASVLDDEETENREVFDENEEGSDSEPADAAGEHEAAAAEEEAEGAECVQEGTTGSWNECVVEERSVGRV